MYRNIQIARRVELNWKNMQVKIKDEKSKKVSKRWLWAIYSFVFIALLLFAVVLYADNWLANKLQSTVREKSNGVYALHLQDAGVRIFAGEITLDSIHLEPDFERWQQLPDSAQMPMLYNVQAEKIFLDGLSFWNLIFSSPLRLDMLLIQRPEVHVYKMEADENKASKPLHAQLKGRFDNLALDSIRVDSANFYYKSNYKHNYHDMAMLGINLSVGDIVLDSAAYKDEARVYYAKSIVASAAKSDILSAQGAYRIKTAAIKMNSITHILDAEQVRLVPLYSAKEMSERAGEAVTWMEGEVPALRAEEVDFNALVSKSDYMAGTVTIKSPKLHAYADFKHFDRKGNKEMPHQMVQRMKSVLDIDSISVQDFYLKYEELVEEADTIGYITFENSNITITNLTNIPGQISVDNPAIVRASTKVQGSAPLSFTIQLPLLNENYYHRINGTVGAFEPEIVNSILEPSSFVTVESGHVSKGEFSFELNEVTATGTMLILYNNLEVELLSKKADVRQTLGQEVISEVINWVAIKEENPDEKGEKPRVAQVNVSRNPKKSVFNYWKDCLGDGILSTLGLQKRAKKL